MKPGWLMLMRKDEAKERWHYLIYTNGFYRSLCGGYAVNAKRLNPNDVQGKPGNGLACPVCARRMKINGILGLGHRSHKTVMG